MQSFPELSGPGFGMAEETSPPSSPWKHPRVNLWLSEHVLHQYHSTHMKLSVIGWYPNNIYSNYFSLQTYGQKVLPIPATWDYVIGDTKGWNLSLSRCNRCALSVNYDPKLMIILSFHVLHGVGYYHKACHRLLPQSPGINLAILPYPQYEPAKYWGRPTVHWPQHFRWGCFLAPSGSYHHWNLGPPEQCKCFHHYSVAHSHFHINTFFKWQKNGLYISDPTQNPGLALAWSY